MINKPPPEKIAKPSQFLTLNSRAMQEAGSSRQRFNDHIKALLVELMSGSHSTALQLPPGKCHQ
jgi:hypothetical protein